MFSKGDIVSITFRNGVDRSGNAVLLTLERAEVLNDCEDGLLKVSYRNLESADQVEIDELTFNVRSSDLIMAQWAAKKSTVFNGSRSHHWALRPHARRVHLTPPSQ